MNEGAVTFGVNTAPAALRSSCVVCVCAPDPDATATGAWKSSLLPVELPVPLPGRMVRFAPATFTSVPAREP
jgi:hypothetical protein